MLDTQVGDIHRGTLRLGRAHRTFYGSLEEDIKTKNSSAEKAPPAITYPE